MYVGRTKDLNARLQAHKKSEKTGGLTLFGAYSGLSWAEARGLEQLGITYFNTIGSTGLNSINGISPDNPRRSTYLEAAWNYLYNQATNEYYNFTGQ